jgi:kumamolisin
MVPGSAREVRPGARVLGVADADEWIELTIKIRRKKPLPEPAGFPVKALTREELGTEYGADPADVEKVKAVLTGLGLKILREEPISCSIRVGGAAGIVESAFLVKLFHYSHPDGNYRGRKGNIHIPAELEGIVPCGEG